MTTVGIYMKIITSDRQFIVRAVVVGTMVMKTKSAASNGESRNFPKSSETLVPSP